MSDEPTEIPDQLAMTLALLRLRLLVIQMGTLARAARATQARQREAHKERILTEMMQRHDRLDA